MKIGALVREGRKRKNWNQTELAEKMGVHQTHVSQWENGEKRIYGDDLVKISCLLGIVEQIFPEYKKIPRQSDTRRYLSDRIYKVETHLSSQIKILEEQLQKQYQQQYKVVIVSSNNENLERITRTMSSFYTKAHIEIKSWDTFDKNIWERSDISLFILDIPQKFCLPKFLHGIDIPVILLVFSQDPKWIIPFLPGVVGVIQKPFEKNDIHKTLSKINLIEYDKKNTYCS